MLIDTFYNGKAAFFKLTQIRQAGIELAQLNIVKATGRFFAVPGNKRYGSTTIQQIYRRFDLVVMYHDFQRDLMNDFLHDVVDVLRKLTLRLGIVPQQNIIASLADVTNFDQSLIKILLKVLLKILVTKTRSQSCGQEP